MKKVTYAIIGFLLLLAAQSKSQNLIALQTNGVSTFFSSLPAAVAKAQDGDTIYIPGGSFEDITINKRLHLIGVGHHPDSTVYTNYSFCSSITLAQGAHRGSISGIKICNLNIGTSVNDSISYFTISRCWIGSSSLSGKSAYNSFSENIIQQIGGNYLVKNNVFVNNIIGYVDGLGSSTFKNNIFLSGAQFCGQSNTNGYGNSISSINNSTFENNFIRGVPLFVNYSIFNNNLFSSVSPGGENVYSNNLFIQDQGSIFVNETGNVFNYTHDYHMKPDSPGKNAGRDGTDIGIYGGAYPWKAGSVPANPHFQRIKIGTATDGNGNLNVKIKVAAQDN